MKKVPDLLEQFVDKAAELLNDRSQAVVLCGATLMLQVSGGRRRCDGCGRGQMRGLTGPRAVAFMRCGGQLRMRRRERG